MEDKYSIEIEKKLNIHFNTLYTNVTSIVCVLALLDKKNKVEQKHINELKKYIQSKCFSSKKGVQKGGESMPGDYFGYINPAYTINNGSNETDVNTVDFKEGIARQAIDMKPIGSGDVVFQSGGGTKNKYTKHISENDNDIKKFIYKILKAHKLTISKKAYSDLIFIINVHMNCLETDFNKNLPITPAKLDNIFKNKTYAIFN